MDMAEAEGTDPRSAIPVMAKRAIEAHRKTRPALFATYKGKDNEHCIRDSEYHLGFLFEAAGLGSPLLFVNYIAWAKVLMKHLGIEPEIFRENLEFLRRECQLELRGEFAAKVDETMGMALAEFDSMPETIPPYVDCKDSNCLATAYLNALLDRDRKRAYDIIMAAKGKGVPLRDIYLTLQKVQYELGRQWQHRQISVAQEHYATAVTQQILAQFYPDVLSAKFKKGTAVVACVGSELHEMGARMVADFLEMDGWDVSYLGANTPPATIVAYLHARKARMLLLSATMGTNVHIIRDLIAEIRKDEALAEVRVIVGGYPFNQAPDLWLAVGADGTATDAQGAVEMAEILR
jgi:methanogenic corrinoid protein MtbC1